MIITKEQLAKQLDSFKQSQAEWVEADLARRKEFAKAFGWVRSQNTFGYREDPKPAEPTWSEIFVELGKLLASQKALLYVTDVEQMKLDLRKVCIEIGELKNLAENNQ